ncbi:MAG: MaoC/PaaZ C-terminal domain-containing protein [Acidimicrobiia bacterium]|nr:MaoC/PaaZ C-terminal domain-containing protein [Acidimicrobiia bacterium]
MAGLVDRTYGPRPLPVTGEAVSAYVAATGDDPDRWKTSAPPGYAAAALFVVAPELLDELFEHSVIHGEQTFNWLRPITIGAKLEVAGTVSKARERGGVHFVTFEIEVSDFEGQLGTGSALFLVSGEATAASSEEGPEPAHDDAGDPAENERSVSRAGLLRYAAATGDWNPVHWDHRAAVEAGLPGVVVHGLLQAAWAFQAATEGTSGERPLASARVRFRAPLLPAHPVMVAAESNGSRVDVSLGDATTEFLSARVERANE